MSSYGFKYVLFSNAAAGNGPINKIDSGGLYAFAVSATFGSCKLQMLGPDDITWIDIEDAVLTTNGAIGVYLPVGCSVRAVGTGGSAYYATLKQIAE